MRRARMTPACSRVSTGAASSRNASAIGERSTITGDWWGARTTLYDHGVTFNALLTQTYQSVVSGGPGVGHEVAVAPILGHGISEDRHHLPPIPGPHGFALERVLVAPGSSTGLHRHDDSQVVVLIDGDWEVALNQPPDQISKRPATGSLVSIPASSWRDLRNVGSTDAQCVVVTGGDGPTRLEWSASIVEQAAKAGFGLDAAGCLAPLELLGRS